MSSETVFSMQAPTLDNTLGAVFLAVIFSSILFGISTLQVYLYYHFYPSDSRLHKFSVAILWVLDVLHLALTISSAYHYGVWGFGDLVGLGVVVWEIKLLVAINVVIILMVQSLYAYRVWLLGGYHHGVLGYLVCAAVLGGFAVGIVLAYATYSINSFAEITGISWAIYACFSASTTIDIILSAAMCFYLRKSKGNERALNSRISTLMQYTLSCGVFTSACSVACLFSFVLMPNNLIFLSLTFILTRLYVNSFMAMLNARARQRTSTTTLSISGVGSSPSHHQLSSFSFPHAAYVQRTVSVRRDWEKPAAPPPIDVELQIQNHGQSQSPASYQSSAKYDWEVSPSPTSSAPTPAQPMPTYTYARGW
ncbi:hypothetical protein MKEN_01303800 [Mycena kentingensis (nom. inval.)]|nr:hypothetical protein MKEN_01303800 [Mycena kentingensis (nom. inval.)]